MAFISFLGGLSAKMYDDFSDNNLLQKFHNKTFMEFLKGIHFISFTTASIQEPLFFIVSYLANVLNYFGNYDAYSEHYEYSLLFSFLLLFAIIDYTKITAVNLFDKILILCFCSIMFLEPILLRRFFQNSEFSLQKMIMRITMLVFAMIFYVFATSMPMKYIYAYIIGYFVFSVGVQCYSLHATKKQQ
jgi:hypothetical protein